jgi:non-homologous end joining protein Ku
VLNRATGCRARRQFIGEETGEPVEANAQVKGIGNRRARGVD